MWDAWDGWNRYECSRKRSRRRRKKKKKKKKRKIGSSRDRMAEVSVASLGLKIEWGCVAMNFRRAG